MEQVIGSVKAFRLSELPLDVVVRMVELSQRTWPRDPPETPQDEASRRVAEARAFTGRPEHAAMSYAVIEHDRVLAMAHTFAREIDTSIGRMTILALGGVVVVEDQRGIGLGRAVVEAAFRQVDNGVFPFSLFQTEPHNRGFYSKLGAVFIDNPIVNSLDTKRERKSPFGDDTVVRYPAGPGWPDGEIDLRGPGY